MTYDSFVFVGGSITLASANPFVHPLIDTGFLTTDFDIYTIRAGVRAIQHFMASSPWRGYVIGPFGSFANVTTDEAIDAYVRQNARSIYHPVRTTAMSAWNATYGVVNPDLTVKKTKGLRIVDADVMVRHNGLSQ